MLTTLQAPAGRTRSGREFSAYQPEVIYAPIDYARLMEHAVSVQIQQDPDEWLQQEHGYTRSDESPLTTPPSSPRGTPSTIYILPLEKCIAEVAASELAATSGAGQKRPAPGKLP